MDVTLAPELPPVSPSAPTTSTPSVGSVRSEPRSSYSGRSPRPGTSQKGSGHSNRSPCIQRSPQGSYLGPVSPDTKAPAEMVLAPVPTQISEIPNWVFSQLKEALPPTLNHPTFQMWLSYLYEGLTLVTSMTAPSPEQVILIIGRATILRDMDTVAQFLAILSFIRGLAVVPNGRWTYLDFLDRRSAVVPEIYASLQAALAFKPFTPAPIPPPYSRISPLINLAPPNSPGPLQPGGGSVLGHSFKTLPPTVLNPPPPFNSSGGMKMMTQSTALLTNGLRKN